MANDERSLIQMLKNFGRAMKMVYNDVNHIAGTFAKVDQSAANFVKTMGGAAETMQHLRNSTLQLVKANELAINYGVNAEKLIQLQQQYIQQIGRRVQSNNEGLTNFAATTKLLGDQGATDMMSKLENFGISMTKTGNKVGRMFADATKQGIAFETYSKNFMNNIEIAQNYTFEKGLRGLEEMARKASEIKLDMQQAVSFANKVNTVEGAINVGAKLQVLGGSFSQFADPLGMLNESLNDMEGLQDRMIKMMGNLGRFNKETGEVEVSAFNKQRVRVASEAMGVSYQDMMKMINSKARRNEIENQLSTNKSITDDIKKLILNIGTIENGRAGVNLNGEFIEVSKITNQHQEQLIKQNQSQSEDVKDIARTLRGWDDMRKGRIEQYKNAEADTIGRVLGNVTKSIDAFVGELGPILGIAATVMGIGKISGGLLNGVNTFRMKRDGGLLDGPSHSKGGMKIQGTNMEVEGGEFVVNKKATKRNLPLLQAINQDKYEDGGVLGQKSNRFDTSDFMTFLMFSQMMGSNRGMNINLTASSISEYNSLLAQQSRINRISQLRRGARFTNPIHNKVGKLFNGKIPKGFKATPGSLKLGGLTALMGIASSGMMMHDTNLNLQSGELERGSKDHRNEVIKNHVSMGSSIGSGIGMFLGPFGSLIGAALGGLVGWGVSGIENAFHKEARDIKRSLKVAGLDLKGDYKKRELESIRKSMKGDRKISYYEFKSFPYELQEKLIKNNDYKLPSGISWQQKRDGGLLDGPSHSKGGMKIQGTNMEVEGGEFVVNKKATKRNLPLLQAINQDKYEDGGIIKPRITSEQKPLSVIPTTNQNISPTPQTMEMKPINLNISGSIKLETNNGQSVDIIKELTNNPNFVKTLTDMIEKQMTINSRGGNVITKGLR